MRARLIQALDRYCKCVIGWHPTLTKMFILPEGISMDTNTESKSRNCPYCKEEIKADAVRCKHCRSTVVPEKPTHGGTCPYCKEAIHPEAIKCKHCGSSVGPSQGCAGCSESRVADPLQAELMRALASSSETGGSGGDAPIFLVARRKPSGTGSSDLDCALTWAKCTLNCSSTYPDDRLMRESCEDSCNAQRNLCRKGIGGIGGGGIIIF